LAQWLAPKTQTVVSSREITFGIPIFHVRNLMIQATNQFGEVIINHLTRLQLNLPEKKHNEANDLDHNLATCCKPKTITEKIESVFKR
jgi:hypothetical protein